MLSKSQPSKKMTFILIGNPGVGKSTILNGFLRAPKFKSGVSLGKGITSALDRQTDEHGNVYIDTPGLSDIKMRKQASEEIVKALKFGGLYKIFFVLTLEEGRIRPDDKTTMGLVLGAAPEIQHSYSIIINKVSDEIKNLMGDVDQFGEFLALLNEGLPGTNSVFVNEEDDSLKSKSNVVPDLTLEILGFLRDAPVVNINPEKVNPIKEEAFEALREMMAAQLQALKEDRKLMEARMAKQDEQFKEMERIQQRKDEQHLAELKAHREQIAKFQSQLLEQQQQNLRIQRELQESLINHEKHLDRLKCDLAQKQREHERDQLIFQQRIAECNNQAEKQREIDAQFVARENQHMQHIAQIQAQNQQIQTEIQQIKAQNQKMTSQLAKSKKKR